MRSSWCFPGSSFWLERALSSPSRKLWDKPRRTSCAEKPEPPPSPSQRAAAPACPVCPPLYLLEGVEVPSFQWPPVTQLQAQNKHSHQKRDGKENLGRKLVPLATQKRLKTPEQEKTPEFPSIVPSISHAFPASSSAPQTRRFSMPMVGWALWVSTEDVLCADCLGTGSIRDTQMNVCHPSFMMLSSRSTY